MNWPYLYSDIFAMLKWSRRKCCGQEQSKVLNDFKQRHLIKVLTQMQPCFGYKIYGSSSITCQELRNWDYWGTMTCTRGNRMNKIQILTAVSTAFWILRYIFLPNASGGYRKWADSRWRWIVSHRNYRFFY